MYVIRFKKENLINDLRSLSNHALSILKSNIIETKFISLSIYRIENQTYVLPKLENQGTKKMFLAKMYFFGVS